MSQAINPGVPRSLLWHHYRPIDGSASNNSQMNHIRSNMSEPTKQGPNTLSLPFVEALYADYLRDSASVPPAWREYFSEIGETNGFAARPQLYPSFPPRRLYGRARSFAESLGQISEAEDGKFDRRQHLEIGRFLNERFQEAGAVDIRFD